MACRGPGKGRVLSGVLTRQLCKGPCEGTSHLITPTQGTLSSGQATLSAVRWLSKSPCGRSGIISRDLSPPWNGTLNGPFSVERTKDAIGPCWHDQNKAWHRAGLYGLNWWNSGGSC